MRKIFKSVAVIIAFSLLLSLTACNVGLKRKTDIETDESKFVFTLLADDTYGIKAKSDEKFSGTVILPTKHDGKSVTQISGFAFENAEFTKIASSTCTVIGQYAFYNCRKLQTVEWADNLTDLKNSAFECCVSLINVGTLPKTLKRIESRCFANCVELRVVNIPASVEYIADDAFLDCEKATFYVDTANQYYKVENNKIVRK
ncbi:MAG TPA: hypothetical protein DDY82_00880 [Clostridiales bacterium]|nr:hypothetical protein [Clostridiales bacterium]